MKLDEDFAGALLHQVPVGIGVWDATDVESYRDLKLIYVNQWAQDHLLQDFPNHAFIQGVFEVAKSQSPRVTEIVEVNGYTYRIHYRPIGKVVAASIFEDITDVNEANRKLTLALESAKAGMWWFDYAKGQQSWDSGIVALTGMRERGELKDVSLSTMLSCIAPKDVQDVEALLTRSMETPGVENVELEFRIIKPDGRHVTVMDRVRLSRDVEGRVTQAMHVLIDITDKDQLTMQLQQSNGDLKNFAHVASHDLREPLRVIINYVTLLFEEHGDKLTDPSAQQYREFIETSSVRAMSLVDDLLRFSRAGSKMNPQLTSLSRLVQIATENLKIAIEEVHADVHVAHLPHITCDAGMMVQVFQNLIGNAVKFSTISGPKVEIVAKEKNDHWLIQVVDNGIGIEADYLTKIFTPFYRLYTTAEYAGTGIGLALCQKIVRAHGGEIWAESGGRGRGTTLNFTLPKLA